MTPTEPPIDSPCIRNCCLNDDEICLGCFRSIDEIMSWSQANASLRKQFLDNAGKRAFAHKQKYAAYEKLSNIVI